VQRHLVPFKKIQDEYSLRAITQNVMLHPVTKANVAFCGIMKSISGHRNLVAETATSAHAMIRKTI
jgi:hypothetical protein